MASKNRPGFVGHHKHRAGNKRDRRPPRDEIEPGWTDDELLAYRRRLDRASWETCRECGVLEPIDPTGLCVDCAEERPRAVP